MYKPSLSDNYMSEGIISAFGGYNHNLKISENEFCEEQNITSDYAPVFSPRNKRAKFNVSGISLQGLFAKTKLCYINNGVLYYGGTSVSGLSFPDIEKERQLVSLGAKLLVFPDKVYINTNDLTDYGSLDAEFSTEDGTTVTFSLCKANGTLYSDYSVSSSEPESPANGALWVDTSVTPNVLKQYTEYGSMWIELVSTYVRISAAGIGAQFEVYDGVTVSGATDSYFNSTFTVWDKADDYIVVTGIIGNTITQTTAITVERKMPEMDYFTECGNRVWGCSSENNEIYCSKLGDAKNWNSFMGISTDSYAVSVGTDGEFTGAASFRGYVLFFKENCVHKICGTNPPFTVTSSYLRGVQKGSAKSLVTVNETLYYKAPNGICMYEGGIPISISEGFGNEYYTNAVGGALRNKYYVCMSDKNGLRHLFTYDEGKGVWHKEDNTDVLSFATHNCNLYMLVNEGTEKRIYLADGENRYGNFTGTLSGYSEEADFKWSAQTGLWGLSLPENNYSAITFRVTGSAGTHLDVYFQYDSSGEWVQKASVDIKKTGSLRLPFITKRCDHLNIKLCGKGSLKIYGMSYSVESGSGLNV